MIEKLFAKYFQAHLNDYLEVHSHYKSFISHVARLFEIVKRSRHQTIIDKKLSDTVAGIERNRFHTLKTQTFYQFIAISNKASIPLNFKSSNLTIPSFQFNYPGQPISFTFPQTELTSGQIYYISGKNGLGKSTLLKTLAGLYSQQQRLALLRGLLQRPRLLILDEALTGVDAETEHQILSVIKKMLKDDYILYVSHSVFSEANKINKNENILTISKMEVTDAITVEEHS